MRWGSSGRVVAENGKQQKGAANGKQQALEAGRNELSCLHRPGSMAARQQDNTAAWQHGSMAARQQDSTAG